MPCPFWWVNQVGINQRIRFIYWVLNKPLRWLFPQPGMLFPQALAAPSYVSAVSSNVTSWEYFSLDLCSVGPHNYSVFLAAFSGGVYHYCTLFTCLLTVLSLDCKFCNPFIAISLALRIVLAHGRNARNSSWMNGSELITWEHWKKKWFPDLDKDLLELQLPRVAPQKPVFLMPEKSVFLVHSPVILTQQSIFSSPKQMLSLVLRT